MANTLHVFPALPTVAELCAKEIEKVDFVTEKKILAGFDYTFKGKTYHFSLGTEDQANFSQMINSANLALQIAGMSAAKRTATFGDNIPVDYENWATVWQGHADNTAYSLQMNLSEFLDLAKTEGAHIQGCLAAGWEKKAALRACADEVALKAKVAELELDIAYRNAKIGKF